MKEILIMAWRYLAYHKFKTATLVLSITLIIYLPVGLKVVVDQSAESLTARAEVTPLIVGAKGSPLELVLNTLYFGSEVPESISYAECQRILAYDLAVAVPVYTRFMSGQHPIVGTTLDYFEARDLPLAAGRPMSLLGECVLGAKVAGQLNLTVGGAVVSSPVTVFDLAGVYPLKMRITGILSPTGTPDDNAIFTDIKTTWIIEGLAHGHQDLSLPEAAGQVLAQEGNTVVGNASVMQYNEIRPDNLSSFHFHGDPETFPITAVIVIPHDEKASTLLQGKYLDQNERMQIVRPVQVMDELLATILTIQHYVTLAVVIVGLSTLSTSILVFILSLHLRRREINTMHKIGGSQGRIFSILASEIVVVMVLGILLAGLLTVVTASFGPALMGGVLMR